MIQAIIFDCFGVLVTDAWQPFKEKYFGHDKQLFEQAGTLNKQANRGLISYDDFVRAVAELAAIPRAKALKAIAANTNVPNEPLLAYIAEDLKPHYKIGLLSNAASNWLHDLFRPDQLALFDTIALSFETGFIKPDKRAYEAIAEQLGLTCETCVLIDDQERFCDSARAVGMQTILYQDFSQVQAELEKLLG